MLLPACSLPHYNICPSVVLMLRAEARAGKRWRVCTMWVLECACGAAQLGSTYLCQWPLHHVWLGGGVYTLLALAARQFG
jgi:hypothetical protein